MLDTEKFINEVKKLGKDFSQGVHHVITPRFVPSCTDEVLRELGKLAKKHDLYVQSHCSEGQWEHDFVKQRFKKSDTEVLRDFGLLGEKSIMAHCNFSSQKDAEIFAETKTSISHCPISNAYFANSVLEVKRLKSQGVNIGLATDISAGFSASIYDNIRQSVICSRILEDGVDSRVSKEKRGVDDSRVSVIEAFYLATTGGGKALGLPLGLIKEGYICDLQVVEMEKNKHSMFNSSKEMLQKVLYLTEKENIKQVWIQGKLVHEKI